MATFSFYGNKPFTSGEGGAITLDGEPLETRLRILRGQGMDPARRYYFPVTGYNFRLTNLACAILCAQIERRDQILTRRQAIFDAYRAALAGVTGIGLQPVAEWAQPTPWLFCITVDARAYGRTRDELMAALHEAGIETRPFFVPLHALPPFREGSRARNEHLPRTDSISAAGLNLPTHHQLTEADIDRITSIVRNGRR
jgi:perosamine synthetase